MRITQMERWLLALAMPLALCASLARSADSAPAAPPADPTEEWIKQSKNPVPWFKWGADLRLREEYHVNDTSLTAARQAFNKHANGNEFSVQRYRGRLWSTITPFENIEINSRIVYEPRHYDEPNAIPGVFREWQWNEVTFDNLNIKWKEFLGLPLTWTVGRQDIILGDGWLVLDGTPLDGSRTIYFDAVRGTYEFKDIKTTVDAIYLNNSSKENRWIEPFNYHVENRVISETKDQGTILWVSNKQNSKMNVDGYFIWREANKATSTGYNAEIYAPGVRISGDLDDHWKYRAELAQESGHTNFSTDHTYADLCALGFNSRLAYFLKDELNNNFRLSFEYESGDDPDTKSTNEKFDPLWGRWPQFSEAQANIDAMENLPGLTTNQYRVGPGWSINPTKKLEFAADYYLLFAPENSNAGQPNFSNNGNFRGQLMTMLLKYQINAHLSGHGLAEFYFPGNYYSSLSNDPAVFLRYELVCAW
jgi:hypothetical protein